MDDLISRQALMQSLGITNMDCDKCAWHDNERSECKRGGAFVDACCAIEDALTIEERKRGKWIIRDNPGTGWYRVTCSECGEDVTSTVPVIGFSPNAKVLWDYCPNCGADMRGETDE